VRAAAGRSPLLLRCPLPAPVRLLAEPCTAASGARHPGLEGAVPQLDTVQVDSSHGPDFLHAEAQLAKYRAQLDLLEETALSPEQSRDLIGEIAHDL
jgi:hypothetical protein